jgi:hypothetical protein
LDEAVKLPEAGLDPLDVDAALVRLAAAVGTEAVGNLAAQQVIDRAAALVAPHHPIDVVVATVVLDDGVPPGAVVRVVDARLLPKPA